MERLTVIGCGTMGPSIALAAALAGLSVNLYGINNVDIKQGKIHINKKLKNLKSLGYHLLQEREIIMDRITTTTSLFNAIEGRSFIIEAIPEEVDLKKKLFTQISGLCGKDVIIASNTSGLAPSLLSSSVVYPGRFIVTHFWYPAHLIPLVEVVPAEMTQRKTVNRTLVLLKKMNKKPVFLKKEIAGFIGNRLQFALFREALYLLQEGIASKDDIDAAVIYGFGRRLCVTGPFVSADLGGLDIYAEISDYLFESLTNSDRSFPVLKNLVNNKYYGCKTGKGFYEWTPSSSQEISIKREKELIRFLQNEL
jgi:3-hydroxybutyryl-CoA dehydrogenase